MAFPLLRLQHIQPMLARTDPRSPAVPGSGTAFEGMVPASLRREATPLEAAWQLAFQPSVARDINDLALKSE
jgi:hypothetical protein